MRAGAALHGKTHRLVEHQHVGVLVKRDRLDEGAVLLRLRRVVARRRRFELERRDAQLLPGLEAILRLRALAVDPHLALADDALDVAERQAGKPRLEEAIDAHAVFVGGDADVLHAGRKLRWLCRCHWWRRGRKSDRLLARRASGKGPASAAIAFRRMLCAQIGLPGVETLFGSLLDRARRGHVHDRAHAVRRICLPPPGWRGPLLPRLMPCPPSGAPAPCRGRRDHRAAP